MTLTTEQRERIARGLGFEQWADGIWRRESDGDSLGNADEIDTDPRFFGPLVQAINRLNYDVDFGNGDITIIPFHEFTPHALVRHNNTLESMLTALCFALLEVMPDE